MDRDTLLTFVQCGNVRLQQLLELFADVTQFQHADRSRQQQRVDLLAEIIQNQIAEIQTAALPER